MTQDTIDDTAIASINEAALNAPESTRGRRSNRNANALTEAVGILRDKNYAYKEIAAWLEERGVKASAPTISKAAKLAAARAETDAVTPRG